MTSALRLAVLSVVAATAAALPTRAEITLKDADRVVLFGDASMSRTLFSMGLDQFLRLRYPELKAEIITLGAPRNRAEDGNRRLAVEVLPLKPTCVVLCFGLEAGRNKAFDPQLLDEYVVEMSRMMDTITETGAQLVVLTPPPPEQSRRKSLAQANYDEVVAEYAKAVTKLATDRELPVLDWYGAVKKYRREFGNAAKQPMTEHGIIPSGLSNAIATDLLLSYWQAEPFEFLISADWKSNKATATSGTVSVLKHDKSRMVLGLGGIPVAPVMYDRGVAPEEAWPMCKWCSYKLKIANVPPGGAVISEDNGDNPKPFLNEQLAGGADLSSIGPLAAHKTTYSLMSRIQMKLKQVQKYGNFCRREVPYPEFKEAYALFREAERALVLAHHQVLLHTPTTLKTTLRIELVKKGGPAPQAQAPTKPRKPPKRAPRPLKP